MSKYEKMMESLKVSMGNGKHCKTCEFKDGASFWGISWHYCNYENKLNEKHKFLPLSMIPPIWCHKMIPKNSTPVEIKEA